MKIKTNKTNGEISTAMNEFVNALGLKTSLYPDFGDILEIYNGDRKLAWSAYIR